MLRSLQAYVRDIIYGGNDGILSIFGGSTSLPITTLEFVLMRSAVAAATGTGNATKVYSSLVLGVAKWFAGAVRDYIFKIVTTT